jgi:hypothetical protein
MVENPMVVRLKKTIFVLLLVCVCFMSTSLEAHELPALSKGQTVYVPAYSHIYIGGKKRPFELAITLSIRNIDLSGDITLKEVNYFGSQGNLVESFIDDKQTVGPQESVRFVIGEKDKGGGSGANFIVKWESASKVNPPIIESIMIGGQSSQGISFTSRGRPILID